MTMLRGSRGWLFSVSGTPYHPYAVSLVPVYVDLARELFFFIETDFITAFQLIMHSHKDVSLMQFQVNACLFYNIAK